MRKSPLSLVGQAFAGILGVTWECDDTVTWCEGGDSNPSNLAQLCAFQANAGKKLANQMSHLSPAWCDTLYIHTASSIAMGNKKSAAGCQIHEAPPSLPTVRQVAQRLLDALDRLNAGTDAVGFHGWENGLGEPAGDQLEEVRHELEVLLAKTPAQASLLTGADFDSKEFERIWKSSEVQRAGKEFGWRGIAEAVWAAAFQECVDRTPKANVPMRHEEP